MAAYLIIQIEKIYNNSLYKKYIDIVKQIVNHYNGRYIVKSDRIIPFSGNWNPEKLIIISFPSLAILKKCFQSEAYLKIKTFRKNATSGKAVIVDDQDNNRHNPDKNNTKPANAFDP